MSIKSLAEDFDYVTNEESYDVKSLSAESLACSDDDEYLVVELMHKMTPAVLSKLRRCFRSGKDKGFKSDIDRRVEDVMRAAAAEEGIEFAIIAEPSEDQLWITDEKFITALDGIFGHHKYTTHAHKLFQLLDPFSTGRACWSKLVDRLVVLGARRTRSRVDEWKNIEALEIKRIKHCKRETIVKIVDIERSDSFCFIVVTRGGRVGVYSGDLKLLFQYEVFYHRTGIQKRVKNCWITDAIYMDNVQVLVLSASDRSLTFYDITTLTHTPIYCITGIPNIPTCMAYCSLSGETNVSELAFGSERGEIIRLRFLRPNVSLFLNNSSDRVNYYFWMELNSPPHLTYCSIWKRRIHSRSIRRLIYIKDGEVLLSCSHDNKISVTAISLPGRLKDYVYSVKRGVSCFHIVPPLHLLATGSPDGVVRLYDVTQTEAHAQLKTTARVAVVDVVIVAASEIVLAVCSNCTVHIWDMYEECILQTIKMKFPFLGALGKKIEFGAYSIHPGPGRITPAVLPTSSRRSSSVLTASGGLVLQSEEERNWTTRALEDDNEYNRFARSELIVSCRDYICILPLHSSSDPLKPPPRDSLAARRPSLWDGPKINTISPRSSLTSQTSSPRLPEIVMGNNMTSFKRSISLPPKIVDQDLESLLEKAELQGILEKDFVLMQGLKHDLNRKLAEMDSNMHKVYNAVNVGAPYLALNIYEPAPMEPVNEMTDEYIRVMSLFPGPSITGTPSGSVVSTPRMQKIKM